MSKPSRKTASIGLFSVLAIALAQLACSMISGTTPTPEPAPPVAGTGNATEPAAPLGVEPIESPVAPGASPSLPDRPLSESGPWVVFTTFAADHELWALNADGSGLTMLWSYFDEDEANYDESFTLWPAPRGGRVAVLQYDRSLQSPPQLRLLALPSGDMKTLASLQPSPVDYQALEGGSRSAADQVWAAVGPLNNVAWSSDGRLMAFNAAIDGPSADVYDYDTSTDTIARLTDGANQSVNLAWSPDNRYVVHGVADTLYYGYSGLGYGMLGAWAVPPDPGAVATRLYDHAFIGFDAILGWLDDSQYLVDSLDGESLGNCGYFNLRKVDMRDGAGPVLLPGNYSMRAFDPATGTLLLSVSSILKEFDCPQSLDPGVYLLDIHRRETRLVPEVDPEAIGGVAWSEDAGVFFLNAGEELLTIDPGGSVNRYPSIANVFDQAPIVRPGGDMWALTDSLDGNVAVGTRSGELFRIDAAGASHPFWTQDGAWLFFFTEDARLYAAPAPEFDSPVLVKEGLIGVTTPLLAKP